MYVLRTHTVGNVRYLYALPAGGQLSTLNIFDDFSSPNFLEIFNVGLSEITLALET